MLKGISPLLSPELLKALDEMGHGDTLVIADGNFPAESVGKNAKVIRADGHGVPELLDAVLALLPLDAYVDAPVSLMEVVPGDTCGTPKIWDKYKDILHRHEPEPCKLGADGKAAMEDKCRCGRGYADDCPAREAAAEENGRGQNNGGIRNPGGSDGSE